MQSNVWFRLLICGGIGFATATAVAAAEGPTAPTVFQAEIRPILQQHCLECHGGQDEAAGDVDLAALNTPDEIDAQYGVWETALRLVDEGAMPPEDRPRLSAAEQETLQRWYDDRFVRSVEAHPGFFRPRRLSAHEYRNTLRSLFGFDLKVAIIEAEQTVAETSLVMKLLPLDPPGPSGFKNDTSTNPLTSNAWDQYVYLIDTAIQKLFQPAQRAQLEAYTGAITGDHMTVAQGEQLIRKIARRAFRRPVRDERLTDSLAALQGKQGPALEAAVQQELTVLLMSPSFLYRGLLIDLPQGAVTRVDDHELAERLSYFLWADMPDTRLMELAAAGRLSDPEVYAAEIERLLTSPRARNLASDFATQWLSLDQITKVSNNPPVAHALRQQPIDFIHYLFAEDRPLIELIDSRTTFANHHTAKFYPRDRKQLARYRKQKGIEVEAVPNQRLTLEHVQQRGGLLTMPGVLAMNRGPVLRGTWMLERILGRHLPDPPADVGQVPSSPPGENLTFRERFEQHRSKPSCAVCHDQIDPLGFAMQAYDAEGKFIGDSNKGKRLDTAGRLPSGEAFDDYQGLKTILVTSQRKPVIRNIVRRTLAFALCRKLERGDAPAVNRIVETLDAEEGSFQQLVHLIATSLPFTHTVLPVEGSAKSLPANAHDSAALATVSSATDAEVSHDRRSTTTTPKR